MSKQIQIHSDFLKIKAMFVKQWGETEGLARYQKFLKEHGLDETKKYHPKDQFEMIESFSWVQPLISYYKQDKNAKYYLIRALSANISMNYNDYRDPDKMVKAASSLSYRPINLNHNHSQWLDYPDNRVDFTNLEDETVEGTLRISNNRKDIQDMIANRRIVSVSIEARPAPDGGYHFTGIALLTKDQLPGDPTTEIVPLFNESIKDSLIESMKLTCSVINGKIICKTPTTAFLLEKIAEKDRTIEELKHQAHQIKRASKAMNQVFIREGKAKINVRTGKLIPWEDTEL